MRSSSRCTRLNGTLRQPRGPRGSVARLYEGAPALHGYVRIPCDDFTQSRKPDTCIGRTQVADGIHPGDVAHGAVRDNGCSAAAQRAQRHHVSEDSSSLEPSSGKHEDFTRPETIDGAQTHRAAGDRGASCRNWKVT